MKKGPIILGIAGIIIIAALMLMPRSPEMESTAVVEDHSHTEEVSTSGVSAADSLVDEALGKMESGELPPMQAVLSIRDISEQYPQNVKANFTLGVMSMQTGQYSKALDRFTKVLSVDPGNIDAHILLARSNVFLGDTSAAVEGLESVLSQISDEEMKNAIQNELASINPN